MDDEKRQEQIKGTKCETCCDSDWCWNALTSMRDDCIGPFKDPEDFKMKWHEFQKKEAQEAVIEKLQRKQKYEEFRENRSFCEHKTDLAKIKKNEDESDK